MLSATEVAPPDNAITPDLMWWTASAPGDVAKHVFQVHGIDGAGAIIIRRKLRREDVVGFFTASSPCLRQRRPAVGYETSYVSEGDQGQKPFNFKAVG